MAKNAITPAEALFTIMKQQGGISYKDLAVCILSSKPLLGGVSPVSRANDRTWVSRYLVHAPIETLQPAYFTDYGEAAMRIIARLKSRKKHALSHEEIIDLVTGTGSALMEQALMDCSQDVSLYKNMLARITNERQFSASERAEMAMVLLVAAGCSADVRAATEYVMDFVQEVHGSGILTPLTTPRSTEEYRQSVREDLATRKTLGLVRVIDGYVVGSPHWISSEEGQKTEIGSLALQEGAVTAVGRDVSGRHACIWRDETGEWFVEGLGSKHGTVLLNGATRQQVVVEPPRDDQMDWQSAPIAIHPGDELQLGIDTRFVVITGVE